MRSGDPWGAAATGEAGVEGHGSDADLAVLARERPGALVRFVPNERCDLARAVGLTSQSSGSWELPIDALDLGGTLAVNMLTVGARPDRLRPWTRARSVTVTVDDRPLFEGRATSVVVANGQYLAGLDVVPRGHPGDGRLDVQVYALRAGERAPMRHRLAGGTHLPHPRIITGSGRHAEVCVDPPVPAEVDGVPAAVRGCWQAEVTPTAFRLLV